jgi:DHA1 family inner membrane transport protein
LASTSLFSVFTYIAPILQDITGVSPHGVTIMLLLFGVGLTAGSMLGGRLADSRLLPSLVGMALAVVVVLAAFSQTSHSVIPPPSRWCCGESLPSPCARSCNC